MPAPLAPPDHDPRRSADSEPIETWLDRALVLGDRSTARQLLVQWAQCRERDTETLTFLADRLEAIGDHAEEATVRDELLLLLSTPFDRAGERCRAATAARRAQQWARALDHLDHAALLHRPRAAWRALGLGHDLIREAYELALAASSSGSPGSPAVVAAALTLARELAAQTPGLPPNTLELQQRADALPVK